MKRVSSHPPSNASPVWAGLGALVALALHASTASAAFSYATCPGTTSNPTILPVNTGTAQFERFAFNPSNYNNNQYYYYDLYFNPNVGIVEPSLKNVNTESGFDWISVISKFNNYQYSGSFADGLQGPLFLGSGGPNDGPANALQILWKTDLSVNLASTPRFDQMALACTSGAALTSWPIGNNQQVEGMLLGTGDVHYFQVPHVGGERMAFSLEVLAAPGTDADVDLYVSKTNPFPNDSSYDWRDFRSNYTSTLDRAGAFINVGSNGSGTYYIGIHSYHGAAHYVLHASGYSTTNKSPYTICMEGSGLDPNAPYWATYRDVLTSISARVAQYTQGAVWPLNWVHKIVPAGTCGSDEYCKNASGCDFVALGCGLQSQGTRTHMSDPSLSRCTQYANPTGYAFQLSHEFGHSQFAFGDEYVSPAGPFCGHTVMNGPDQSHSLCTPYTHCKDPALKSDGTPYTASAAKCASGTDDWSELRASGKAAYVGNFEPAQTIPDQWDSLRNNSYFKDDVSVTP